MYMYIKYLIWALNYVDKFFNVYLLALFGGTDELCLWKYFQFASEESLTSVWYFVDHKGGRPVVYFWVLCFSICCMVMNIFASTFCYQSVFIPSNFVLKNRLKRCFLFHNILTILYLLRFHCLHCISIELIFFSRSTWSKKFFIVV